MANRQSLLVDVQISLAQLNGPQELATSLTKFIKLCSCKEDEKGDYMEHEFDHTASCLTHESSCLLEKFVLLSPQCTELFQCWYMLDPLLPITNLGIPQPAKRSPLFDHSDSEKSLRPLLLELIVTSFAIILEHRHLDLASPTLRSTLAHRFLTLCRKPFYRMVQFLDSKGNVLCACSRLLSSLHDPNSSWSPTLSAYFITNFNFSLDGFHRMGLPLSDSVSDKNLIKTSLSRGEEILMKFGVLGKTSVNISKPYHTTHSARHYFLRLFCKLMESSSDILPKILGVKNFLIRVLRYLPYDDPHDTHFVLCSLEDHFIDNSNLSLNLKTQLCQGASTCFVSELAFLSSIYDYICFLENFTNILHCSIANQLHRILLKLYGSRGLLTFLAYHNQQQQQQFPNSIMTLEEGEEEIGIQKNNNNNASTMAMNVCLSLSALYLESQQSLLLNILEAHPLIQSTVFIKLGIYWQTLFPQPRLCFLWISYATLMLRLLQLPLTSTRKSYSDKCKEKNHCVDTNNNKEKKENNFDLFSICSKYTYYTTELSLNNNNNIETYPKDLEWNYNIWKQYLLNETLKSNHLSQWTSILLIGKSPYLRRHMLSTCLHSKNHSEIFLYITLRLIEACCRRYQFFKTIHCIKEEEKDFLLHRVFDFLPDLNTLIQVLQRCSDITEHNNNNNNNTLLSSSLTPTEALQKNVKDKDFSIPFYEEKNNDIIKPIIQKNTMNQNENEVIIDDDIELPGLISSSSLNNKHNKNATTSLSTENDDQCCYSLDKKLFSFNQLIESFVSKTTTNIISFNHNYQQNFVDFLSDDIQNQSYTMMYGLKMLNTTAMSHYCLFTRWCQATFALLTSTGIDPLKTKFGWNRLLTYTCPLNIHANTIVLERGVIQCFIVLKLLDLTWNIRCCPHDDSFLKELCVSSDLEKNKDINDYSLSNDTTVNKHQQTIPFFEARLNKYYIMWLDRLFNLWMTTIHLDQQQQHYRRRHSKKDYKPIILCKGKSTITRLHYLSHYCHFTLLKYCQQSMFFVNHDIDESQIWITSLTNAVEFYDIDYIILFYNVLRNISQYFDIFLDYIKIHLINNIEEKGQQVLNDENKHHINSVTQLSDLPISLFGLVLLLHCLETPLNLKRRYLHFEPSIFDLLNNYTIIDKDDYSNKDLIYRSLYETFQHVVSTLSPTSRTHALTLIKMLCLESGPWRIHLVYKDSNHNMDDEHSLHNEKQIHFITSLEENILQQPSSHGTIHQNNDKLLLNKGTPNNQHLLTPTPTLLTYSLNNKNHNDSDVPMMAEWITNINEKQCCKKTQIPKYDETLITTTTTTELLDSYYNKTKSLWKELLSHIVSNNNNKNGFEVRAYNDLNQIIEIFLDNITKQFQTPQSFFEFLSNQWYGDIHYLTNENLSYINNNERLKKKGGQENIITFSDMLQLGLQMLLKLYKIFDNTDSSEIDNNLSKGLHYKSLVDLFNHLLDKMTYIALISDTEKKLTMFPFLNLLSVLAVFCVVIKTHEQQQQQENVLQEEESHIKKKKSWSRQKKHKTIYELKTSVKQFINKFHIFPLLKSQFFLHFKPQQEMNNHSISSNQVSILQHIAVFGWLRLLDSSLAKDNIHIDDDDNNNNGTRMTEDECTTTTAEYTSFAYNLPEEWIDTLAWIYSGSLSQADRIIRCIIQDPHELVNLPLREWISYLYEFQDLNLCSNVSTTENNDRIWACQPCNWLHLNPQRRIVTRELFPFYCQFAPVRHNISNDKDDSYCKNIACLYMNNDDIALPTLVPQIQYNPKDEAILKANAKECFLRLSQEEILQLMYDPSNLIPFLTSRLRAAWMVIDEKRRVFQKRPPGPLAHIITQSGGEELEENENNIDVVHANVTLKKFSEALDNEGIWLRHIASGGALEMLILGLSCEDAIIRTAACEALALYRALIIAVEADAQYEASKQRRQHLWKMAVRKLKSQQSKHAPIDPLTKKKLYDLTESDIRQEYLKLLEDPMISQKKLVVYHSFKEFREVLTVLNLLKESLEPDSNNSGCCNKLPFSLSGFVTSILPILLDCSHPLYMKINRYIAGRSFFETTDAPLLISLLYPTKSPDIVVESKMLAWNYIRLLTRSMGSQVTIKDKPDQTESTVDALKRDVWDILWKKGVIPNLLSDNTNEQNTVKTSRLRTSEWNSKLSSLFSCVNSCDHQIGFWLIKQYGLLDWTQRQLWNLHEIIVKNDQLLTTMVDDEAITEAQQICSRLEGLALLIYAAFNHPSFSPRQAPKKCSSADVKGKDMQPRSAHRQLLSWQANWQGRRAYHQLRYVERLVNVLDAYGRRNTKNMIDTRIKIATVYKKWEPTGKLVTSLISSIYNTLEPASESST